MPNARRALKTNCVGVPVQHPGSGRASACHAAARLYDRQEIIPRLAHPLASLRNRAGPGGDIVAMTDGRLRGLFWRVVDALDYLVTLVRLRILDALAGPEPETPADQQRARDRERIARAFPAIEP
jgi:hypothetical protein